MKFGKLIFASAISSALFCSGVSFAQESDLPITANIGVTSNYLWRGLTQSNNEAAVQGGLDYAHESGFYIGTWASNVNYGASDDFSFEHDIYFGFSGEAGDISYDVGYLYYNYDTQDDFDFGEIYGTLGYAGFSASVYLLTNTEHDEELKDNGEMEDFEAFGTYYLSLDYGVEIAEGLEVGAHIGYHDGDFAEAFNGVTSDYTDYNISVTKGDFTFMYSDTTDIASDAVANDVNLRNSVGKFVVSWSTEI